VPTSTALISNDLDVLLKNRHLHIMVDIVSLNFLLMQHERLDSQQSAGGIHLEAARDVQK
jgi:hypothetical protein